MEKYFSLSLCAGGCCSSYSNIYKNDPDSNVFIVSDGNDAERDEFFSRIIKNLRGYSISLFNPFYDESPDGIYIKGLNTYILSAGGYNRINTILPGKWEKYINISPDRTETPNERKEILRYKSAENEFYKKGCKALRTAGNIREKLHGEIAPSLDDDKIINFIKRFCSRTFRASSQTGKGEVRFLSTPTPLGIHTHFTTIFDNYEKTVSFRDETGFVSSVILGIIKSYAISEKIPFYFSPSYYFSNIPQYLLFPSFNLCIVAEDEAHLLPFTADSTVNASRFLSFAEKSNIESKSQILLNVERKLLDNCVLNLYEGSEQRFKARAIAEKVSDLPSARLSADKLTEKIL